MNKTLKIFSGLFIASVLGAALMHLAGYNGLYLNGELFFPSFIRVALSFSLFMVQFWLMCGFILEKKIKLKTFCKCTFIFAVSYSLYYAEIIPMEFGFIHSTILPLILVICISCKKKTFINFFICFFIISTYQFISGQYKNLALGYSHSNYEFIYACIDLLALYILIYYIRRCKNYALETVFWRFSKNNTENSKIKDELKKLGAVRRALFWSLCIIIQFLVFGFILFMCGYFLKVFIETFIILISFAFFGLAIKDRYHCKTFLGCALFSLIVFGISSKVLQSMVGYELSQFLPISVGFLIMYLACIYKKNKKG